MKYFSSGTKIFTLIVILFICASSVCAATAQDYFKWGTANYFLDNPSQAIKYFTRAIELDPNYAEAYEGRAAAYEELRKYNQAISDYTRVIKLNPEFENVYCNRGIAYYKLKKYNQAWADVHKAEKLGYSVDPQFLVKLRKASGRKK